MIPPMILMKFYRNVICRPSTTHWVGDDIGDCTHVDVHDDLHDDLHDVHASSKNKEIHAVES